MSVSYVSSGTDVPGVQTAISHLQDLESNMRAAQGFQAGDVSHIDVIIQCIQDLERERMKSHEQLETETIKASVLRHKLLYYPDEIKNEISEAVGAARRDNEEELASLNRELNKINDDITHSSAKLKEIDDQNEVLHPERDRVKAENEEVIAHLNERMAEKATKQITLNDTRDKLRDTNQRIVELEEGLVVLKEELIQERNDHRIEKSRLQGLTKESSDRTRDQKHSNAVKKLELTNLRDEYGTISADFSALNEQTLRVESDIQSLNKDESELQTMLEEQIHANEKLREKGEELQAHGVEMDKDFELRKSQALAKIEKMNRDIDREKDRGEVLEGQRKESEDRYLEANEIRKNYEAKVKELKDQLQRAQEMYKSKVEDIGRLTQESQDMELRLVELAEEHDLLVRNLNTEIASEREKLSLKRKERLALQAEREVTQKVLTDFRGDQQKYLREMNKRISELRSGHDDLTEEGRELRKFLKQNEKDIAMRKVELAKAQEDFQSMKTALELIIKRLEWSVANMSAERDAKLLLLAERTPIFQVLEKEHNQVAERFDNTKKNIIALKNKKNGLDDAVQRLLRDIEKLNIPRRVAEDDLRAQRALALEQFNSQAASRQTTERELYSVGVKLKTVLEENDRFRTAGRDLEKKKEEILRALEEIALKKDRLARDLEQDKCDLIRAWLLDQNMTEENAERDQAIVEQFSHLLGRSEERQQVIAVVSRDLAEELGRLDQFLKTVSSKRPKEVRKDVKRMTTKRLSREGDGTRPPSQVSTLMPGTQTPMTLNTSRDISRAPTREPSRELSRVPSRAPTREPSRQPSRVPSRAPSTAPPPSQDTIEDKF